MPIQHLGLTRKHHPISYENSNWLLVSRSLLLLLARKEQNGIDILRQNKARWPASSAAGYFSRNTRSGVLRDTNQSFGRPKSARTFLLYDETGRKARRRDWDFTIGRAHENSAARSD